MKRLFDLIIAVLALTALSPLLVTIALLVVIDSRGPVFFRQKRIGQLERPFVLWKFRTMRHRNPDEIDQVEEGVITTARDSRITAIGRLLRAASLDELPQLYNVLQGTMSMVGPRPIMPEQMAAVPAEHKERFCVRPGITGWAQVNGRRGLDWMVQLELDCWYARHHSLSLDLRIMLSTIPTVLRGSGVYGEASANWRAYLDRGNDG